MMTDTKTASRLQSLADAGIATAQELCELAEYNNDSLIGLKPMSVIEIPVAS